MVDLWCASYPRPPPSVILDIDDTLDVVHGHQQLSLFNAHYDERCFLPSMSTTPKPAGPSPFSCARARPRPVWKCGAISVGLFAGSGSIGRQPASPSAAMPTTAGPK